MRYSYTIKNYSEDWNFGENVDMCNSFVGACVEQNSIQELEDCLARQDADYHDINTWGLSGDNQYFDAIKAALNYKLTSI